MKIIDMHTHIFPEKVNCPKGARIGTDSVASPDEEGISTDSGI